MSSALPSPNASEARLPWRDWLLLPLAGVLTVSALLLALNLTAGHLYKESKSTTLSCLVLNDPTTGVRAIPNSVCYQKIFESELAEYRFNACGHRAGMECGPKSPGVYRIVMVGSSYNYGMWVPREKSFAALVPQQLSQITGKKIELYNESMQWGSPASTILRLHEVFEAQPDMILWVLNPYDIGKAFELLPYTPPAPVPGQKVLTAMDHVKLAFAHNSIPAAIGVIWDRAVVVPWNSKIYNFRFKPVSILLEHLLYANQTLYLKSSLMMPDKDIGYLLSNPTQFWQDNVKEFDRQAAVVEGQAKAAGIPFVAVLVPQRSQAAMISDGQWPDGYDPFKLDNQLRTIVTSHGGIYFDVLPEIRKMPGVEKGFFPVDGHPDANGHAMLASLLVKGLTSGAVPALDPRKSATPSQAATGQSK